MAVNCVMSVIAVSTNTNNLNLLPLFAGSSVTSSGEVVKPGGSLILIYHCSVDLGSMCSLIIITKFMWHYDSTLNSGLGHPM